MTRKERADVRSCSEVRSVFDPTRATLIRTTSDATKQQILLDILIDPDEQLRLERRTSGEDLLEGGQLEVLIRHVALGQDIEVFSRLRSADSSARVCERGGKNKQFRKR